MMVAKAKIQEAGAASRDKEQDSKRCYSSTLEQSIQAWQAKTKHHSPKVTHKKLVLKV
jgi:hypothetical protein